MRTTLATALVDIAAADDRIVLLTADLGFMVLENFADKFPDRFINVGVAEANMLSVAAGMAAGGFIPYCYSIATFASMRGFEQLRNGAVVHRLPIRVIGIGGGFSYGSAGITHHALEDFALMRSQPGMTVIAPVNDRQTEEAIRSTVELPGPIYFRVAKDSVSHPEFDEEFRLGAVYAIGDGDVAVIATGAMSAEAFATQNGLRSRGIAAKVCLLPTLQPLDVGALVKEISGVRLAVTLEDHHVNGGVGSLVAETIAEAGLGVQLVRHAVSDVNDGVTGSERYLKNRHHLEHGAVVDAITRRLA